MDRFRVERYQLLDSSDDIAFQSRDSFIELTEYRPGLKALPTDDESYETPRCGLRTDMKRILDTDINPEATQSRFSQKSPTHSEAPMLKS